MKKKQHGRRFADNNLHCIFLIDNGSILIEISLKFVSVGPIGNKLTLVWVKAASQYTYQ